MMSGRGKQRAVLRCALCALATLVWGCGLDSRTLFATDAGANAARTGDGPVAGQPDPAAGRWRRQRAPTVIDAPNGASGASAPNDHDADMHAPDAALSPDAGAASPDAGIDAGSDAPLPCHELVVSSQWIDAISNCLEIQGAAFVKNPMNNVLNAHVVSMPICMQDTPPDATGPASMGFNLNQTSPSAEPIDYDALQRGVTGFRFRVTDYLPGLPLPFVGVESQGEIYCKGTAGYGDYEFRLDELRARCWDPTPGPAPDPAHVRSLVLYYPASWPGDSIGMCVDRVFAIVER